jgi:hypothetical protein
VASIGYFLSNLLGHNSHASSTVWPSAHLSVAERRASSRRRGCRRHERVVGAIERARTTLERAFPFQGTPVAVDALDPSTARLLAMIQDMTDVIIVASLIIAACSLAVNIAAGLGERKRPFSLLRLTGVPTALLASCRRAGECAATPPCRRSVDRGRPRVGCPLPPLPGRHRVPDPGIAYWATVLGGLAASLAIIASTFPLLNRITGPEVARNE